jgi:hypothetical protein
MKFLAISCLALGVIWGLIAAHYLNFDRDARERNLEIFAKKAPDAKLAQSFVSDEYKGFVYAK